VPATVDHEVPTIAFFAHVDTAREVTGTNVQPVRRRYEGAEIALGDSGQVLRPGESPQLAHHVGHELITTDGTTLLGADDKAGIAEIMAAVAHLVAHPELEHGPVKIAFNPDEEIGRGVTHFPVDTFGAVAAYTVDGSTAGEIQEETFSGAQVRIYVRGRAIHPGWADGELVNAIKLAAEIVDRLPKDRLSPETTSGRDGFIHPILVAGDSSEVELRFIVRDFEDDLLDQHVETLRAIARDVCQQDVRCAIDVDVRIQYRNMRDTLLKHPEIVDNLEEAVRRVGLEPKRTSIRGGTDGSALTEMGLPTPNIFTGGHDAHSEREWICVEDMGLAAATVIETARVWAERSA
jgi:tripeptide aminopeptidase